MALQRNKAESTCHDHDLAIQKLESKMEVLDRHHGYYKEKFGGIELMLEELKYFSINTNNSIDHFKDIPDRVRKLEDKSIFMQVFEKLAWIAVGALIVSMVNQKFIAPKEEKTYGIEYKVR